MRSIWIIALMSLVMCLPAWGCNEKDSEPQKEPEKSVKKSPAEKPAEKPPEEDPGAGKDTAPAKRAPEEAPEPVEKSAAAVEPVAPEAPENAWNDLATLEAVAPWLPADTVAISILNLEMANWQDMALGMLEVPDDFDHEAMFKELGEFVVKRVGVDLTRTRWLVAAMAMKPQMFVVFAGGDFGEIQGPKKLIEGLEVWDAGAEGIKMIHIPESSAMAFVFKPEHVPVLSDVRTGMIPSLRGAPALDVYRKLLSRMEKKNFVFAAQFLQESWQQKIFGGLDKFIPPDGAMIAGDAQALRILITGSQDCLSGIEGHVTTVKGMVGVLLGQGMAKIDDMPMAKGLGLIAGKHLWEPVSKRLTPRREGDFMWLDTPSMGGGLQIVSLLPILSVIAVPAFIKYMRKSKTVETIDVLDQFHKGAIDYYTTPRVGEDGLMAPCAFPPSGGPVPKVGSCCASQGGADTDGDDRCDGDEAEWDAAFGAFRVSHPGNHYFVYQVINNGLTGAEAVLILRATGDLDCDGDNSTFERRLTGAPTTNGVCKVATGGRLFTENETE